MFDAPDEALPPAVAAWLDGAAAPSPEASTAPFYYSDWMASLGMPELMAEAASNMPEDSTVGALLKAGGFAPLPSDQATNKPRPACAIPSSEQALNASLAIRSQEEPSAAATRTPMARTPPAKLRPVAPHASVVDAMGQLYADTIRTQTEAADSPQPLDPSTSQRNSEAQPPDAMKAIKQWYTDSAAGAPDAPGAPAGPAADGPATNGPDIVWPAPRHSQPPKHSAPATDAKSVDASAAPPTTAWAANTTEPVKPAEAAAASSQAEESAERRSADERARIHAELELEKVRATRCSHRRSYKRDRMHQYEAKSQEWVRGRERER